MMYPSNLFYSELEILFQDGSKARINRESHNAYELLNNIRATTDQKRSLSFIYSMKKEVVLPLSKLSKAPRSIRAIRSRLQGTNKIIDVHLCVGRK